MKIQTIQNQSFEAKQRFLPPNTHKQVQELLNKMNNETTCVSTKDMFSSNILGAIKINPQEAYFYDQRCFLNKAKDFFAGESFLEMGTVRLRIDNKSGEITKHKKPFFKSWKSIYKQTSEVINCACENFEKKEVVEKRFIGITGVIRKACQMVRETQNDLETMFNSDKK